MNAPLRHNVQFLDIDRLSNDTEQAGQAWADAKAAYEALEQTRKSVLAQGMKGYFAEGMTAAKAETMALADETYIEFVKRLVKAGHAADKARVRYDVLKVKIELLRTNASTERAAMSMR
jgi:hypothetical protein